MNFKIALSMIAISMSLVLPAQAHQLVSVQQMSNPLVQAFLVEAQAWHKSMSQETAIASFQVAKLSPSPAHLEETKTEALTRVMKFNLHRTYPITGDDGGYQFTKMNGQSERNLQNNMGDWIKANDDDQVNKLISAILPAAQSQDIVVLYGRGSGNNTLAEIIALLDLKNNEVVYLMASNFGSDD